MQKQIVYFISIFSDIYSFFIFFRIILSWVPTKPNQLTYFISDVTDPYLMFCRRLLPPIAMIDFSPILALFLLDLASIALQSFIISFF